MDPRKQFRMRFVNSMLNVCHLVGFARQVTKTGYLIQQVDNPEQSISVRVPTGFRLPAEGSMIDATCHVWGERINDEPNCFLTVVASEAASVRSIPAIVAWRSGSKAAKTDDFQPFLPTGQLKKDIAERLAKGDRTAEGEQIVLDIMAASGNKLDTRLGEHNNKVLIAGIVDLKRFVEPNEHQKHGYGEVYIRQHGDRSKLIPVRIYDDDVRSILSHTTRGLAVYVEGQIRMKVLPNDQGDIRHRNLHIRTKDLKTATQGKHILETPDWWSAFATELREEHDSRKEAVRKLEAARLAAAQTAADAVVAGL